VPLTGDEPRRLSVVGGTMSGMSVQAPARDKPHETTVVGQHAERESLMGAWLRAVDGEPGFVVLGGEAGIGKSTVVSWLTGRLGPETQHVSGQCVPLGEDGLALAPLTWILRDLVSRYGVSTVRQWAGPGWPALSPLLPSLVEGPARPHDRLQQYEAVTRIFEHAATVAPLLVVVEDLHWADESTLGLLRFVSRAVLSARLLVVCTFRSDELPRRHPLRPFLVEAARQPGALRVDMSRLSQTETAELIALASGRTPSPALVRLIAEHSQGIPYFVTELASATTVGCLRLPDTLRDALGVRLSRLSDITERLMALISVAGNRIDHDLLAIVAAAEGLDSCLEECLREAVDAAILVPDESGYSFRHSLLREVLYDDLLPGEHARLHARFAAVLTDNPDLGSVLDRSAVPAHWFEAHDLQRGFASALGVAGIASLPHAEALSLYARALDVWDRVADPESVVHALDLADDEEFGAPPSEARARILQLAGVRAYRAGEMERGLTYIGAALERVDAGRDPLAVARLLVLHSRLLRLTGVSDRDGLLEALRLTAPFGDTLERAQVLNQLSMLDQTMYLPDAAAEAQELLALAGRLGHDAIKADALVTLGCQLGATDPAAGLELMESARPFATQRTTRLRLATNLSDALFTAGQYEKAVEAGRRGLDTVEELGRERKYSPMLLGNIAEPLLALGRWQEAEQLIQRGLDLDAPLSHTRQFQLLLAELRCWQDRADEAETLLATLGGMLGVVSPDLQLTMSARSSRALAALASGQPERAWAEFEASLGGPPVPPIQRLPVLVGAGIALRQGAGDRTLYGSEVERSCAAPGERARAYRPVLEAYLDGSRGAWMAAAAGRANPALPVATKALVAYELARALHDDASADAADALAAARAEAADLGAALIVRWCEALAPSPAGDVLPRPGGLTSREIEVLRLVAEGRSNSQVGRELFISTKTASVHVSNIIAKLGVASRGEAAAWAHAHGVLDEPPSLGRPPR
jgi:DNA-binding CsgD family transcriptional regulator/tetratricopeptide (TPR) repeat protein